MTEIELQEKKTEISDIQTYLRRASVRLICSLHTSPYSSFRDRTPTQTLASIRSRLIRKHISGLVEPLVAEVQKGLYPDGSAPVKADKLTILAAAREIATAAGLVLVPNEFVPTEKKTFEYYAGLLLDGHMESYLWAEFTFPKTKYKYEKAYSDIQHILEHGFGGYEDVQKRPEWGITRMEGQIELQKLYERCLALMDECGMEPEKEFLREYEFVSGIGTGKI